MAGKEYISKVQIENPPQSPFFKGGRLREE
jgi:hypothetical protein